MSHLIRQLRRQRSEAWAELERLRQWVDAETKALLDGPDDGWDMDAAIPFLGKLREELGLPMSPGGDQ